MFSFTINHIKPTFKAYTSGIIRTSNTESNTEPRSTTVISNPASFYLLHWLQLLAFPRLYICLWSSSWLPSWLSKLVLSVFIWHMQTRLIQSSDKDSELLKRYWKYDGGYFIGQVSLSAQNKKRCLHFINIQSDVFSISHYLILFKKISEWKSTTRAAETCLQHIFEVVIYNIARSPCLKFCHSLFGVTLSVSKMSNEQMYIF